MLANMSSQCFQILGLEPAATAIEVRQAYRKVALLNHPDKPGGSEERMKQINAAYEQCLKDCEREEGDEYFDDVEIEYPPEVHAAEANLFSLRKKHYTAKWEADNIRDEMEPIEAEMIRIQRLLAPLQKDLSFQKQEVKKLSSSISKGKQATETDLHSFAAQLDAVKAEIECTRQELETFEKEMIQLRKKLAPLQKEHHAKREEARKMKDAMDKAKSKLIRLCRETIRKHCAGAASKKDFKKEAKKQEASKMRESKSNAPKMETR